MYANQCYPKLPIVLLFNISYMMQHPLSVLYDLIWC